MRDPLEEFAQAISTFPDGSIDRRETAANLTDTLADFLIAYHGHRVPLRALPADSQARWLVWVRTALERMALLPE